MKNEACSFWQAFSILKTYTSDLKRKLQKKYKQTIPTRQNTTVYPNNIQK